MITVAQGTAVPLIPAPRGRFSALTVGTDSHHLVGLTPRLRSLGAAAVHNATSARSGQIPQPVGPHDVCVLDAALPILPDELRGLRALGWRRVVVVAPRSEAVRVAIASGARSCVVPPLQPTPMSVAPPRPSRSSMGSPDALSEREVQVLQGVAEGLTNKQIGEELHLSALTVKSHLARIARKLGTGDRAEMVAIGIRQGLVAA
jgi:DNA-binding CsgD family transcriptional regulator